MIKEYMKHTVEEAARKNILFNHRTVDRTLFGKDLAKFGEINFVQGAEWQSKQSPWISVNERLPEEGQKVFVLVMCYGTPCIREEKFRRSSNLDTKERWIHGNSIVLAWFPIPSFDEILKSNRDVLERIKEKGD
jgi:hypothetical protein